MDEVGRDRSAVVGGKAAHLGELTRTAGVAVPRAWCVTTDAYRAAVAGAPGFDALLDRLAGLSADDTDGTAAVAAGIRALVAARPVPEGVAAEISAAVGRAPAGTAWAVRSSATAEDLPTASFAGQQDSYLNVVGAEAVLDRVRACWASLFTDRAVTYRRRLGLDDRGVAMAVVVQEMVAADVSGVLFTADPVTSDRTVTVVEAVPGLGEALVSGLVAADGWTVRHTGGVASVVDARRAPRTVAVRPAPGGGTRTEPVAPDGPPLLTDDQVRALARLGRTVEPGLGSPQDIEWCLSGGRFQVVQSRPITSLFPVPGTDDDRLHVYLSVGYQQMMTDAMRPLGLSVWQMTTPRPMAEAGGRLFVDVTDALATPSGRDGLLAVMGRSDPLMTDAVRTVLDRGVVPLGEDPATPAPVHGAPTTEPLDPDPALVAELIAEARASVAAAARRICGRVGPELFTAVREDIPELRARLNNPRSTRVFMTAMDAAYWIDEHVGEWLGERPSDALTRSAPDNVTSQMGLALLDVADAIRPFPAAVALLRGAGDDVLEMLPSVEGGTVARDAILGWLDDYGARCVGEIDISRPRWHERPAALVPLILGHIDTEEPGAGRRRFDRGRREAEATREDLLARLRAGADGEARAARTALMIDRLRTFIGYREFPKFAMVSRYAVYRAALLAEADRLVAAGVLEDREDAYFLRFDELEQASRTGHADLALVRTRRAEFAAYGPLVPPRVLTSDGECLQGSYHRDDVPPGALAGLAVSAGTVEGRARVVTDLSGAALEPGDVLVTAYTDPSWSPAFVTIAGLVTEVGGRMTHGAVVAREYGLPAVVGVEDATRLIPDGSRVRVDGGSGLVEILGRDVSRTGGRNRPRGGAAAPGPRGRRQS
ncbi:rifamycin-inactivating phosphotransferase [Pseudonocardia sp. ICBG1293]|uniref:rifamycin-inactivating phosphotransferase n=1 Tax=Pseudonocardia sp. ICBG1293 TaxID=2844382 RepID=UPI001CC95994|nr:rifamycin-inactivating phosphotransferase [Pseudonocardia sp. ICBG1293]